MTLSVKAVSGVKWSSISQFGRQITQWITTIILVRLLSPSDFGLMAMAMVVIGFVSLLKDLGTSAAIIQRTNLSEELLSSIFWFNVAFGFLATAILFLLSPFVANFYREPRVILLLRVISLSFFISSLSILQQAILERNLAFNKLAKLEIIATFFGSFVGIGSAVLGHGVWSLVYQSLAVATMTTILLWAFSTWRPKLIFHWDKVKSVSNYSLNLTGFNIFNYFARNTDYLLIGRFLGAQNLGYYTLAYNIMLYPLQNISAVIGRVMFPFFSQIQEDDTLFRSAYLKVVGAIALITFPMMMGLMVLSEQFVLVVFSLRWQPVILLLIIFAPVGMIQSIGTTVGIIYQAKGRTDWMFRWGIAAGILVIIAFVIGLNWGIVGVATAYAVTSFILIYPGFAIPFRLINLPFHDMLTVVWRPFLSSTLMLVVLLGFKAALPADLSNRVILGILVLMCIITYLLISWIINRSQIKQILETVGVRI
jgi:O-antigen/teichoic acid export membrane protein